jgi:hypothetical protein
MNRLARADVNADPLARDGGEGQRRFEQLVLAQRREAMGLMDHITAGLAWLALHQAPDGASQDDVAVMRCGRLGHEPPCIGRLAQPSGEWSHSPAGTALAVMAFLGFRDLDARGLFEPYLARGVAHLRSRQGTDGRFPGVSTTSAALSLIALGRAAESTGDGGLRDAVRRGLAFLSTRQTSDGGYAYDGRPFGDLRETAWVAQAIEAARRSGVAAPEGMCEGISRFLELAWQGEHRFAQELGGAALHHLSAPGMLVGLIAWDDAKRGRVLDDWRRWLAASRPARLHALYYGTCVATRIEGNVPRGWTGTIAGLAAAQDRDVAAGAWQGIEEAPLSECGYAGVGVVHVTALAVLTLEHAAFGR